MVIADTSGGPTCLSYKGVINMCANDHCLFYSRCVYNAAVWYYNHMAGLRPVVMLTEDREAISDFSALNSGVYVISTQVCGFCLMCSEWWLTIVEV